MSSRNHYLQVEQLEEEQLEQLPELPLSRLLPPPIPKEETSFFTRSLWHWGQVILFWSLIFVSSSKRF